MKFIHIGILTNSLEKSMKEMESLAANQQVCWSTKEVNFPEEAILTGKGSHMRTAIAEIGGMTYELIQPLDSTSYHSDEFRKKGSVMHHVAFMCLDNQDEVIRAQLNHGGKIVWEAMIGEKHPVYVESADGKQIYEFINYDPGTTAK